MNVSPRTMSCYQAKQCLIIFPAIKWMMLIVTSVLLIACSGHGGGNGKPVGGISSSSSSLSVSSVSSTSSSSSSSSSSSAPLVARFTGPTTTQIGTAIALDASTSTGQSSSSLIYSWDFGDGTHGGGAKIAKTFGTTGNFNIRLTVMNTSGQSASATQIIGVAAGVTPGPTVQAKALIKDLNDQPLSGVTATVVSTTTSATTDSQGILSISFSTATNALIKLSKDGYADQFVPVNLPATTGGDAYFEAHMIAREPAQTLSDATQGGTLAGKDGTSVALGSNALQDANGQAVSGAVQVAMTPVDVTSTALNAFPGSFNGITADANSTAIVSYGTVEFALTQNGQRLQLTPGHTATIDIPLYPNTNVDGSALALGDSVPLWSLDETTGLWIQEGTGIITNSTTSPTGMVLHAVVGHFSYWNGDKPIADSFGPKPKCQDSGIGIPGSTDHLADATICNIFGMGASGGARGGVGFMKALAVAATTTTIPPGYRSQFTVPIAGGVSIKLPPDYSLQLSASALNGTWLGQAMVKGSAGTSPEVVIPLSPVTVALPLENITLPYDQTRALPANQTARFGFTVASNKPVDILVTSGAGSSFAGQARLLQGTTVLATIPVNGSTAILNSAPLPDGNYVIEITNSGTTAATFRLQANLVHWSTQGTFITGLQGVYQFSIIYDSQSRPVIMDFESYHPAGDINTTNSRIAFRRLVNGAWIDAATPIDAGHNQSNVDYQTPCLGFALDRNDNPSYVAAGAGQYRANQWNGTTWQAIGANNGALGNASSTCMSAPTLRFDNSNHPTVVYDTVSSLNGTTVRAVKFDGTVWQPVGPNGGSITSGIFGLSSHWMELDSTGKPYVEWDRSNGSAAPTAYVLHYVDTPTPAWIGVGSNSGQLPLVTGQTYAAMAGSHLVLDSHDRPAVASTLSTIDGFNNWIAAFQFDGATWLASSAHTATSQSVTVFQNAQQQTGLILDAQEKPLIAWGEGTTPLLYMQRWTAGAWQGLGAVNGLIDDATLIADQLTYRSNGWLRTTKDGNGNPAIAFYQYDINVGAYRLGVSVYVP